MNAGSLLALPLETLAVLVTGGGNVFDGRYTLGSRLNQVHHRIQAAMATADRKFRASLS